MPQLRCHLVHRGRSAVYDDELLGFARQEREVVCHLIVVDFRAAADLDDDHVRDREGGDVHDWVAEGVASSLLPAPSSLT